MPQGLGLDAAVVQILNDLCGEDVVKRSIGPVPDGRLDAVVERQLFPVARPEDLDGSLIPSYR